MIYILPKYLDPFTKPEIDKLLEDRDKAIAKRAIEVGKSRTSRETGWSIGLVNSACGKNKAEEKENTHEDSVSAGNNSQIPPKFFEISNQDETGKTTEDLKSSKVECKVSVETRKYNVKGRGKCRKKPKPLPDCCFVEQPEILPKNAAKIELTRGVFAIIDADMYDELSQYNWCCAPDYKTAYAIRGEKTESGKVRSIRMHRTVMRVNDDPEAMVDHRNNNGLDNRRENLRLIDDSGNQLNRSDEESGFEKRFKGVGLGSTGGFTARLIVEGKMRRREFRDQVKAALWYDSMIRLHRGPDAETNLTLVNYSTEEIEKYGIGK